MARSSGGWPGDRRNARGYVIRHGYIRRVSRIGRIAALLTLAALAAVVTTAIAGGRPSGHPATAQALAYARLDTAGNQHDVASVTGDGKQTGHETVASASTAGG